MYSGRDFAWIYERQHQVSHHLVGYFFTVSRDSPSSFATCRCALDQHLVTNDMDLIHSRHPADPKLALEATPSQASVDHAPSGEWILSERRPHGFGRR
jgi:hypothetical protein